MVTVFVDKRSKVTYTYYALLLFYYCVLKEIKCESSGR